VRRRFEKYIIEGSKYAHWIGLYLSFHLNWVLGPFVHGRLQNLQTSEVTFAHVMTPLSDQVSSPAWFWHYQLCVSQNPWLVFCGERPQISQDVHAACCTRSESQHHLSQSQSVIEPLTNRCGPARRVDTWIVSFTAKNLHCVVFQSTLHPLLFRHNFEMPHFSSLSQLEKELTPRRNFTHFH